MPQQTIDLFSKGIESNQNDPFRKGNVIHLPKKGRIIITGDLHGHRRNFEKIVHHADLENHPEAHVIFQEIIHGGPEDEHGDCLSYNLLLDAIRYKLMYPSQVHIILGNHDTAVINNGAVLKSGREMTQAMKNAMMRHFQDHFSQVEQALIAYLLSQPLAVKCANGIWISHSLPADEHVDSFGKGIFSSPYTAKDTQRPNPVYLLTWGRRHSQEALEKMAELLEVDLFILGHQPQEAGWNIAGENLLIVASEHNHGCLVSLDLSRSYTIDQLQDYIIPLASIL